jgi:putative membrane protein
VATPNNANAANANNAKASREIRADRDFITVNAANNYMEVLLGRLALQRSQNSDVKGYAERVVREHNMLQDEWLKVAQENGIPLKPGMGKNHREKLTRLEKLSGKDFDREFMNTMIDTHKDYANSMEKQSRTAHSAAVRNIAERSLPVLRPLFQEAKRVGAEVGANTNVKLRSES